jgi:hypothetical protein
MSNLQLDIRLEAGGGMVYGFLLALSMEGKFWGDHLHSVLLFSFVLCSSPMHGHGMTILI